ncbi:MAG: RsmB/NOP family class I SAM-dependent RNA methyltransferase [Micrococcales bacterium]
MAETPKTARGVAYDLMLAVEEEGAYANLLLPRLLDKANLDGRDSGFAQELAFGTLRNALFYDRIIAKCAGRDIGAIDDRARLVLELGCHQLLGMRVPSHAALSETVDLAKRVLRASLTGFINGVLRRVSEKSRDEWLAIVLKTAGSDVERLSVTYSHPEWVVRALVESLRQDGRQNEIEAYLAADNQAPLVNLVALPGLAEVEDLYREGAVIGGVSPIGGELPDGDPASLRSVRDGLVRVQDQGSQLAALALVAAPAKTSGPQEEWLDLCAGPGGKAALLAAIARKQGANLVCNELLPHRAKLVKQALRNVNPQVYVRTGDGRDLGEDAPEAFDRILLDAPCTGLGALRRRPEARYRKQQSDVPQLAKLQEELFASAWAGLKPGGVLGYVTCSPHPAETTALVSWAQRKFGDKLELLNASEILGEISKPLAQDERLRLSQARRTVQLWPHVHGTDAMFIALIRKNRI